MKQLYDIWFSFVMGVNCANGQQIAASGYGPRLFYNMRHNLAQFNLFTQRQIETAASVSIDDMAQIDRLHTLHGIKSVNYTDREFPRRLKDINYAPLVLFYKGELSLLDSEYTVSIVGSRRCSAEGEKACDLISRTVAEKGAVVVSGLAQGVDSIAHKAAVAAGGRTVAFLGVPLDEYFPKTNKNFQNELCDSNLVVSEYHCTYPYYGANFIYRNRLIAAAGDALCVVQAKERSGSLATVNRAVEYDKPVFAVPGGIFSPSYSGSNQLLVDGIAKAVTDGKQILSWLGYEEKSREEQPVKEEVVPLDLTSRTILGAMDGAMNTNAIIRASGLKAQLVKATLTSLEMDGWVSKTAAGEYVRTK